MNYDLIDRIKHLFLERKRYTAAGKAGYIVQGGYYFKPQHFTVQYAEKKKPVEMKHHKVQYFDVVFTGELYGF
jgi:hypothetical protein